MAYNHEYPYVDASRYNDDWLINKVKELAAEWSKVQQDWKTEQEAFKSLKAFVNNYFDNLDVQQEINNKLDAMVQDGSLYEIIRKYTDPIITEQNNKITVLESRMNAFTNLPTGSTSGDAELQDIRVGYNGITYPTAGDSVRAQARELNKVISNNTMNNILTNNVFSNLYNIKNVGGQMESLDDGIYFRSTVATWSAAMLINNYFHGSYAPDYLIITMDENSYPSSFVAYGIGLSGNDIGKTIAFYNAGYSEVTNTFASFPIFNKTRLRAIKTGEYTINLSDGTNNFSINTSTLVNPSALSSYTLDKTAKIGIVGSRYYTANSILAKGKNDNVDYIRGMISDRSYTVAILGDSLTEQGLYPSALINMGYTIQNYGVSGTTISNINPTNTFISRIANMSTSNDYIYMMGGTNDWGLSVPIGQPNDTSMSTFYGALDATVKSLRNKYKTKSIFISTITQRNWQGTEQASGITSNANGNSIEEFNEAIKYVARKYGCFVIDSYECGICIPNLSTYTSDNLHFNQAGGELFAKFFDRMTRNYPIY